MKRLKREEVSPNVSEEGESEFHARVEEQVDEVSKANLGEILKDSFWQFIPPDTSWSVLFSQGLRLRRI